MEAATVRFVGCMAITASDAWTLGSRRSFVGRISQRGSPNQHACYLKPRTEAKNGASFRTSSKPHGTKCKIQ